MNLTKNKIFFGILGFLILVNVLVGFNLNQFYIRAVLSFIFLITIPGLLIMLMLKIREIEFWEYLVYVVGLSVSFIMFGGLAVNWILPWLNITDKPLSLWPILICFNIFLIVFWITAWIRNKDFKPLKIQYPKLDLTNRIFFITPILFPVLSILGAFLLNNHGTNILTMIMLGGIAVYVFMIVLFRKKLDSNVYPWAILMMSLALLLMWSLRSWHVLGFDVHQEYQVFKLAKENFHWSIFNFKDAYNACLSITILPTILYSFLKINTEYIFKFLFQIIFAFVPVIVFLFLKRFSNNIISFLASFFFISQIWFIQQMPSLARQEIAFLFFGLILLILFNEQINSIFKKSLFIIFGFSMIIAHYSTSYIALALFVFVYLLISIYSKLNKKKLETQNMEKKYTILTIILVFLLLIFAFFWGSQLTNTSSGLINFAGKTFSNMGEIFTEDVFSLGIQQFSFNLNSNNIVNMKEYSKEIELDYHTNKSYINYYDKKDYSTYSPRQEHSQMIYQKYGLSLNLIINKTFSVLKLLLNNIFIPLGVILLLFMLLKKQEGNWVYFFMCIFGLVALSMIIFLPLVSSDYNLTRTYLQLLMFLSLPCVIGGLAVLKITKIKYPLITILFILYFVFYSGFIFQCMGGSAFMTLNNFGGDYDRYSMSKNEINSAKWLFDNYDDKKLIYADRFANLRLSSFKKIKEIIKDIFPGTIDQSAYVYLSETNNIRERTFNKFKIDIALSHNFPNNFLNDNKNKIYTNGGSVIFK